MGKSNCCHEEMLQNSTDLFVLVGKSFQLMWVTV